MNAHNIELFFHTVDGGEEAEEVNPPVQKQSITERRFVISVGVLFSKWIVKVPG